MDTIPVPAPRRLLACVITLLFLSGCGGTPTAQDASTTAANGTTTSTTDSQSPGEPSSPEGPTTETFEDPETEDPEATEEAGGGDGGVQVELPGLPIGGNALRDDTDPTWRCALVNWTGSPEQPPVGVNLTITSLGVTPSDVYELTDGGCSDLGPCLDRPGVLTGGGQCAVAVQQVAVSPDISGELLVDGGTISCAPGDEAVCEQFLTDLDQNPALGRIDWSDALTDWPSSDDETTSDPGTGTQATTGGTDDGTQATTGGTDDGTETTTGGTGDSTAPTATP